MHKWGLAPTSNCECGAAEQTAEHIILTSGSSSLEGNVW